MSMMTCESCGDVFDSDFEANPHDECDSCAMDREEVIEQDNVLDENNLNINDLKVGDKVYFRCGGTAIVGNINTGEVAYINYNGDFSYYSHFYHTPKLGMINSDGKTPDVLDIVKVKKARKK